MCVSGVTVLFAGATLDVGFVAAVPLAYIGPAPDKTQDVTTQAPRKA